MKAKNIKSIDDVSNYIEGCLNDFEEGLSDKDETSKNFHDLVTKIIDMAKSSTPTRQISDEEIEKLAKEKYKSLCLDFDLGGAFDKREGFIVGFKEGMRDQPLPTKREEDTSKCIVCETETDNEVWCDIHTPLVQGEQCPTLRIVDMEQIYYFFENKDGLWLTDDMQLTSDPQKAWKLADEFEANAWVIWNKRFDHLKLKLTEHEFVPKPPTDK